jgi:hypothetical protein
MDYVYICRDGDNEELRYSIRSVVAYTSCRNIWLIGYKPDWYRGNFVSVPDTSSKFNNIINCTKAITDIGAISDDFVLMNDDFFFLNYVGVPPVYHGGPLLDKIDRYIDAGSRQYVTLLSKTYKNLIRQGIQDPLDYDIHFPMPMNKDKLKQSIKKAYFPRSAYGNINNVGGTFTKDVKVYRDKSPLKKLSYDMLEPGQYFVSTEDGSFDRVYKTILKDMFPEPSKYEIQ